MATYFFGKMNFNCDICVIGGGSGGVRAARLAAERGARVVLFEHSRLGGTCVIRGCVPKKLMVYASRFAHEFELSKGFGWELANAQFDWPRLRQAIHAEVDRLSGIYAKKLSDAKVQVIAGSARFLDENTISGGGHSVSAKRTIIACGGVPSVPDVEGIEHAIVSDDIFALEQLPKRMAIVGGGYIALEFACLLQSLGVCVTLIYRGSKLLRSFDSDLARCLTEAMVNSGIDLRLSTNVSRLQRNENGSINVDFGDNSALEVDQVFYATGRRPASEHLGCDAAGISLTAGGEVVVDSDSKTTASNIFAIGDVTGRMNLTPVAIREGVAVIDYMFDGRSSQLDYGKIATAVFTSPELGSVGMTEEQARKNHDIDIYLAEFRSMKSAFSNTSERSMLKLVVDRTSDRVLGAHLACESAGELIQLLGVIIALDATKADFDRTVAVHPTLSEELVTMSRPLGR